MGTISGHICGLKGFVTNFTPFLELYNRRKVYLLLNEISEHSTTRTRFLILLIPIGTILLAECLRDTACIVRNHQLSCLELSDINLQKYPRLSSRRRCYCPLTFVIYRKQHLCLEAAKCGYLSMSHILRFRIEGK